VYCLKLPLASGPVVPLRSRPLKCEASERYSLERKSALYTNITVEEMCKRAGQGAINTSTSNSPESSATTGGYGPVGLRFLIIANLAGFLTFSCAIKTGDLPLLCVCVCV